jgi:hypothetical protein
VHHDHVDETHDPCLLLHCCLAAQVEDFFHLSWPDIERHVDVLRGKPGVLHNESLVFRPGHIARTVDGLLAQLSNPLTPVERCVPLPALPENYTIHVTTRNYWGADEDVNPASRKVELMVSCFPRHDDTVPGRLMVDAVACP